MRTVTVAWGLNGLERVSASYPICVIVDVLSFSTAVDVGCAQGAAIYPFRWNDGRAQSFAQSIGAQVAVQRQDKKIGAVKGLPSLSPASLRALNARDALVLPSPNGSTLSFQSKATCTIAGCLRNAAAVAAYTNDLGGDIAVVAAGERWPDGSLRVALEDLIGAATIVSRLETEKDVEALAAEAVYQSFAANLEDIVRSTWSGCELIERGYEEDVVLASELDVSETVPVLTDGCYRNVYEKGPDV